MRKFIFGGSYSGVAPFTNTYSLAFDGVDESVDCGIIPEFANASQMSISGWYNIDSFAFVEYPIGYYVSGTNNFYIQSTPVNGRVQVQVNSCQIRTNIDSFLVGAWVHITIVYDGSLIGDLNRVKIYVNGSLSSTFVQAPNAPVNLSPTTTDFFIGAVVPSLGAFYQGKIDEVAIFDYALSAGEVSDIYNGGTPNNLMTLAVAKRPEHYYRNGDNDTFPTITDIGEAGGNDGTMVNMEIGDIITDVP
jgi:hypothetical protein